jgi:glutamyl-tRNA synthetase
MERRTRVRFAPSPTGPLHMGGVRTALYNYLFARKNNGDFILRIEDTDQNRFVPGAEQYIIDSLKWSGIIPNEGVGFNNGEFGPYRQSDRKEIYRQYADKLVSEGNAYYSFDSPAELEDMRKKMEAEKQTFAYNGSSRMHLKNSLTMNSEDVEKALNSKEHYVVRIKIPVGEEVHVKDLIRGDVMVNTSEMDDKVLFKSDGMPTYHLANVVDDYLMKITHVIRGEEWLPSAPLHVLLYRFLGWENVMPQFAHLPLLLKPDGNGKLSKRDGDRLGFPVFPLAWTDPESGEQSSGYRERGYFPEAFVNIISLLGWHPEGNQELFTMDELIAGFSLDRVNKAGAKFDPEKAKWFNQQYLKKHSDEELAKMYLADLAAMNKDGKITGDNDNPNFDFLIQNPEYIKEVIRLVREKIHFVNELWNVSSFFFIAPKSFDQTVLAKKWNEKTRSFFVALPGVIEKMPELTIRALEEEFPKLAAENGIKQGEVMQLCRVLLTGLSGGPLLFDMIVLLGKHEVVKRINFALKVIA